MTLNYSNRSALVIDDSRVMIASARWMLRSIGFIDQNVLQIGTGKGGVHICQRQKFDLILCDFNFCNGINGRQVFEELRFLKLMDERTVFIIITGESNATVVRSILELAPDEYMLKPFTKNDLSERIRRAFTRKKALQLIYRADLNGEYEKGLAICNEFLKNDTRYTLLIQKFKGEFLSHLKRSQDAKELYETILVGNDVEWAHLGLANSLVELGDTNAAHVILQKLMDRNSSSVSIITCVSTAKVYSNEIPSAIQHLELASSLSPGNSDRELLIANLCHAEEDFKTSLDRFMVYLELAKDTYRYNNQAKLNLVRAMLYLADATDDPNLKNDLLKQAMFNVTLVDAEGLPEVELVFSHERVIRNSFSEGITLLKAHLNSDVIRDFYGLYHRAYVCSLFGLEAEFVSSMDRCKKQVKTAATPILAKSQLIMMSKLQAKFTAKKVEVIKYYEAGVAADKLDQWQNALDLHIKALNLAPYLAAVAFEILKLLTKAWPREMNGKQVKDLATHCDEVIGHLWGAEQKKENSYTSIHDAVFEGLKSISDY